MYVLENAHGFGGITWAITEFSWDVKFPGLQILASMVTHIYLYMHFSILVLFVTYPKKNVHLIRLKDIKLNSNQKLIVIETLI